MQVTLTTDKARKILKLIHNALHDEIISIRQIARVIGKVNATSPGNKVAALFTKNLENDKIQARPLWKQVQLWCAYDIVTKVKEWSSLADR